MSSTTVFNSLPPDPVPEPMSASGETRMSLRTMFGPTIESHLRDVLLSLTSDPGHEVFVREELGLDPNSEEARRLKWTAVGEEEAGIRLYSMSVEGSQLPSELRAAIGGHLEVQMAVGGGIMQVRHKFAGSVTLEQRAALESQLSPLLQQATARVVNPVLATAVSQGLRLKAQEKLQARYMQKTRLQTRVRQMMNHQTIGAVTRH